MSEGSRNRLRGLIRQQYGYLVSRLAARVGSRDIAQDALHDAFVRLERAQVAEEVAEPTSYILRMAANIASNRLRRDSRLIGGDEMQALLDLPDEDQNPAAESERLSDMAAVRRAMLALPERRRALLTQAWLEERPTVELAAEYGISVRMVQIEIKAALDDIRHNLASPNVIPFRRDGRKVS